jgi:hypothetical protein
MLISSKLQKETVFEKIDKKHLLQYVNKSNNVVSSLFKAQQLYRAIKSYIFWRAKI